MYTIPLCCTELVKPALKYNCNASLSIWVYVLNMQEHFLVRTLRQFSWWFNSKLAISTFIEVNALFHLVKPIGFESTSLIQSSDPLNLAILIS